MWPVAENLAHRPGQDAAGTVLDEDANTVLPGRKHRRREVDRLEGLTGDRLRGRLAGRHISPVDGVGVEANVGHRVRFPGVDVAPGVGERSHGFAVDDHVQPQRDRGGPGDGVDHSPAGRGITADHAIVRCLHDRHVRARFDGQRRLDLCPRRGDAPALPRGGLVTQSPVGCGHPAFTGQLVAVHPRFLDLVEHRLQVAPDPESHQRVGLP